MKKISTISKVAAAAILGTVLLTGCGGGGSSSTAGSSEVVAADGYVGYLNRSAVASKVGQDDVKSATGLVNNGKIKFSKQLDKTWKIAIPADSLVDANNDGNISNDGNATVGFEMSTFGDQGLATPGSTFVYASTDGNATAAEAFSDLLEFDPVAGSEDIASDDNDTKQKAANMLKLLEMIKTVGKNSSVSEIAKLTISASDINSTDLNTSTKMNKLDGSIQDTMKALVATKVEKLHNTIALVQAIKDSGQEIDIATMMVSSSDAGLNIVDLIESADINTTGMDDLIIDANASSNAAVIAEATATAALPQKLILTGDTITVGTTDVVVANNTFNLNLTTDTNATLEDFASIKFPAISVTKAKVEASDYNATFSVMIETEDESKMLRLEIGNAKIALDANSTQPTVEFTTDTTVTISQDGIASLAPIIGTSTTANVNTVMTQSDFSFNTQTLLDNLVSGDNTDTMNLALDKIEEFLSESNTYSVELGLKTDMFTDMGVLSEDNATREITGTVNVNMSADAIKAANQTAVDAIAKTLGSYTESLSYGNSVTLPTTIDGATVTWSSNMPAIISDTGALTATDTNTTVTLSAVVTKGSGDTLATNDTASCKILVEGVVPVETISTDTSLLDTDTFDQDGTNFKFYSSGTTLPDTFNDNVKAVFFIYANNTLIKETDINIDPTAVSGYQAYIYLTGEMSSKTIYITNSSDEVLDSLEF